MPALTAARAWLRPFSSLSWRIRSIYTSVWIFIKLYQDRCTEIKIIGLDPLAGTPYAELGFEEIGDESEETGEEE